MNNYVYNGNNFIKWLKITSIFLLWFLKKDAYFDKTFVNYTMWNHKSYNPCFCEKCAEPNDTPLVLHEFLEVLFTFGVQYKDK